MSRILLAQNARHFALPLMRGVGRQVIKRIVCCTVLTLTACASTTPRDSVIDYLALISAARDGDALLVEALLERGAPVDALHPDTAGTLSAMAVQRDSPLHAAARAGHVDIVRLLLKHKPFVDHHCCDSPPALGNAAEAGNVELVRVLLAAGADPTIRSTYDEDTFDATPLDVARKDGHLEVVRVLEEATSRP